MTRLVAGPATSPLAGAPPCSGSRLALGVRPTLDVLSLVEEPPRPCNQPAMAWLYHFVKRRFDEMKQVSGSDR